MIATSEGLVGGRRVRALMTWLLMAVGAATVSATPSQRAHAQVTTVINFDTCTNGQTLTTLACAGISSITSTIGTPTISNVLAGSGALAGFLLSPSSGFRGDMTIQFSPAVSRVSFVPANLQSGSITAYNASNVQVAQILHPTHGPHAITTGLGTQFDQSTPLVLSGANITRLVILTNTVSDAWLIDNLSFDSVTPPTGCASGTACAPPVLDNDGDGSNDPDDPDDDNDGVPDGSDSAPFNPDLCQDTDSDTCDDCAVGTDNFGPLADNTPLNDGPDTDSDGMCNAGDECTGNDTTGDGDSDGTCDDLDACDADATKTAAGVCGCGVPDTDTDSDGTPNCNDACPADPGKVAAGICGCGVADTDTDADSTPNCNDACPTDPAKIALGACGCGVADTDGDGDGTPSCNDGCPTDPAKILPGVCGCGAADVDSDGDTVLDCNDVCLGNDASGDYDNDHICNDRDQKPLIVASQFQGNGGTCTAGGVRLETGIDENGSRTLTGTEIERTSYVCNGVVGVDGLRVLVSSHPLTADPAKCPNGGVEIMLGTDDDRNGTLASAEVDSTEKICNGQNSLLALSPLAAEASTCPSGGATLKVGVDSDGDGVLADSEVKATRNVCNALGSLTRTTTLPAESPQCAYGGVQIETGLDTNGDGSLQDGEAKASNVVCSANGLALRTVVLTPGDSQCRAGGVRVESGIDGDGDYVLDDTEVQSSEAVCGAVSVLFDSETLAEDKAACAHGGVRIKVGHDDGEPAGVAADGILQEEEVDSANDVCLAATDVLIDGGESSCSLQPGQRANAQGALFSLSLLGMMLMRSRRRRAGL